MLLYGSVRLHVTTTRSASSFTNRCPDIRGFMNTQIAGCAFTRLRPASRSSSNRPIVTPPPRPPRPPPPPPRARAPPSRIAARRLSESNRPCDAHRKRIPALARKRKREVLQAHLSAGKFAAELRVPLQRPGLHAVSRPVRREPHCAPRQIEQVGLSQHPVIQREHDKIPLRRNVADRLPRFLRRLLRVQQNRQSHRAGDHPEHSRTSFHGRHSLIFLSPRLPPLVHAP